MWAVPRGMWAVPGVEIAGGKVEISMHVCPVQGEQGRQGLGEGDVGADVELAAFVAAGENGEWQGGSKGSKHCGKKEW